MTLRPHLCSFITWMLAPALIVPPSAALAAATPILGLQLHTHPRHCELTLRAAAAVQPTMEQAPQRATVILDDADLGELVGPAVKKGHPFLRHVGLHQVRDDAHPQARLVLSLQPQVMAELIPEVAGVRVRLHKQEASLAPQALRLEGVQRLPVSGSDEVLMLQLPAAAKDLQFTHQVLTEPSRLVVDIAGARTRLQEKQLQLRGGLLRGVRFGRRGDGLRVVFDLSSDAVFAKVERASAGVRVALRRAELPPASGEHGEQIQSVQLTSDAPHRARIRICTPARTPPELDTHLARTFVLRLPRARLQTAQIRQIEASARHTTVSHVSVVPGHGQTVEIHAQLRSAARTRVWREGGAWVWEIAGEMPRLAHQPRVVAAVAPQTASFAAAAVPLAQAQLGGDIHKRISLDVRDADIINVLRLISEETGENIIASDDVKGKVTLKLRQVPADQALDTMLRTKGFDRVRQNNILRVAPADTIQKERDMDLARRRSLLEVEETQIRMVTINYATAGEVVDQIKPMLTGRGSIQVDVRTNTLILQDVPANVERLSELVRRLDKQTPLVMIQARIVEANNSHVQDLGIQWGLSSSESSRTQNPTGLVFPGDVLINGAADSPTSPVAGLATPSHYAVNLPASLDAQGAGLGFILGSANGAHILNLRLSAMEKNGTGKIISSPEVATLDNKTARVSQGVEIPITVTSAAGANTRFIPAVLELEVTPHVTNDGTVLLKIKTQKSEVDYANRGAAGDPSIQKRYAETEVLVRDGDTSVIGGIYTRNTSDSYKEVPFLGRIPLLGALFRQHLNNDTRAELLVFITPRIINREESMLQQTPMGLGDTLAPAPAAAPAPAPAEAPAVAPGADSPAGDASGG